MYGKSRSNTAFLMGILLMCSAALCGGACITPAFAQETEEFRIVTYEEEAAFEEEAALTGNAEERTENTSFSGQSGGDALVNPVVEVQEENTLSEQIEEISQTETRVVSWYSGGEGQDVTDRVGGKEETPTDNSSVVIVLDPGHDASHVGARANGLEEEKLTLVIAQYCREALAQYRGVTVYLTRETESCPYTGTSSGDDNAKRVDYAKSVGADAYVSIHLNSAPASSATGFEIFYPNRNYEALIGSEGMALAQAIEKELAALGLYDRGVKVRNSEDQTLYPDGSLADYYGVIKRAKLNGFPGLIVEHAFLTNESDAAFLSAEANLMKLGEADAAGIAAYFGLSKAAEEPTKAPAETEQPHETEQPDETGEPVVTQPSYLGDVNRDGTVGADDALLVLRHVVKLITIKEGLPMALADINADGAVGADDALQILQTTVRLIPVKQYKTVTEEPAAPDESEMPTEPAETVTEEPAAPGESEVPAEPAETVTEEPAAPDGREVPTEEPAAPDVSEIPAEEEQEWN